MKRRKLIALLIGAVIVAALGGWLAASQIRSPAEIAARTAAPEPSPILVPVERRLLTTDVITRGTGRFGSPRQLWLGPTELKPGAGVVTSLPLLSAQLAEGDLIATVSGRPVFLLRGSQALFRDLGPGTSGNDVRQLERALARLGHDPGPLDGLYDEATEAAVEAWYEASGFAAFATTAEQRALIRALETDLTNAELDLIAARDALATAEADLAAAEAAYERTLLAAAGDSPLLIAARVEAAAANEAAAAELRAKQAALAAVRAGAQSSDSEIAAAGADAAIARSNAELARLAAAQALSAARDAAVRAGETLLAVRNDAIASNTAAAAEIAAKEAALTALQFGSPATPGTPAEIAAAQADVATAQANQTLVQLQGGQAVTDAVAQFGAGSAEAIAAQAEADAADAVAAAEVAAMQAALSAVVVGSPRSLATAGEILAAERELDTARANAEVVRLAGLQAVVEALAAVNASPAALEATDAEAAAAIAVAEVEASAKELAHAQLADGPLSPRAAAEIRAAQADVAAAIASAEAVQLAGESAVASIAEGLPLPLEVAGAEAGVRAAEAALRNAEASLAARGELADGLAQDLQRAAAGAGIQLPADELIFVAKVPVRVSQLNSVRGDQVNGPLITVTDAVVAVDGSLALGEARLVQPGMVVQIDEPDLGIRETGVVSRVADTPGTNGVDGFHVYFEVLVDGAAPSVVGVSVRLTLPVESSGGTVLAVPLGALSLAADGSSRVQIERGRQLEFVTVEPGLAASGFVEVTPRGGTLEPGDLVVVGFDQPSAAGG